MHRDLSSSAPRPRCHALDWLRVAALFSVFLLHNLRFFDFMPWHVKNEEQSDVVMQIVLFRITWGMPLLFLIAGAASAFASRRRTAVELLKARTLRLLVPLVVGVVFLIPPQRYIEQRHHAGWNGSVGEFLAADLSRLFAPDLGFSPIWFGHLGYHLWFLGFLFLYGVLGTPLLVRLEPRGRRLVDLLARLAAKPGGLLVLVLPLFTVQVLLVPVFPGYLDWADFFRYFLLFAYGYLFTLDPRFFAAAKKGIPVTFAVGLVGVAVQLWAALSADLMRGFMEAPGSAPGWPLFQLAVAVQSWVWPVFFLGLGLRYLDFPSRALRYLNEAALPFYALHQTVILAVGFYVVELELPILVKLVLITSTSFALLVLLYEGSIRRSNVLLRLFGMKPALRSGRRSALSFGTNVAVEAE